MITDTIFISGKPNVLVEHINKQEKKGWRVIRMMPSSVSYLGANEGIYVVFGRDES